MEVEDEDPFLPRPDASSPSYIRYGSLPSRPNSVQDEHSTSTSYTRGRHGHGREALQMQQRGSTPPPAYNSNTFYRTGEPAFMNHSIPDDQSDYARESIA
ncbi:hypothetical protein LSH36_715g01053 [Paralvinella palmiformis]|uniref:Uncharacterized protein n=1 Tax=Paralvinella palmiformis TaxID=53620 RepID=A0AAD9J259_9ANNE|nr:hypothetical protein LSH36_715g01053 [Paralvinella palmiformis]